MLAVLPLPVSLVSLAALLLDSLLAVAVSTLSLHAGGQILTIIQLLLLDSLASLAAALPPDSPATSPLLDSTLLAALLPASTPLLADKRPATTSSINIRYLHAIN